jgi:hypothetical protein
MCPESSHEGNGGIRIKTEAVSDEDLEEDAMPISFPRIKAECEKDVPGLCSDTCVSSSPDGDGGIEIKTEAVLWNGRGILCHYHSHE